MASSNSQHVQLRCGSCTQQQSLQHAQSLQHTDGCLSYAGDDGDIPDALKQYVDGSAQLPVKTYFIGGYGK